MSKTHNEQDTQCLQAPSTQTRNEQVRHRHRNTKMCASRAERRPPPAQAALHVTRSPTTFCFSAEEPPPWHSWHSATRPGRPAVKLMAQRHPRCRCSMAQRHPRVKRRLPSTRGDSATAPGRPKRAHSAASPAYTESESNSVAMSTGDAGSTCISPEAAAGSEDDDEDDDDDDAGDASRRLSQRTREADKTGELADESDDGDAGLGTSTSTSSTVRPYSQYRTVNSPRPRLRKCSAT